MQCGCKLVASVNLWVSQWNLPQHNCPKCLLTKYVCGKCFWTTFCCTKIPWANCFDPGKHYRKTIKPFNRYFSFQLWEWRKMEGEQKIIKFSWKGSIVFIQKIFACHSKNEFLIEWFIDTLYLGLTTLFRMGPTSRLSPPNCTLWV